jgi:zinc D-Ala-D-Ala carboxypeptidase
MKRGDAERPAKFFTFAELACPCCGFFHMQDAALRKLDALREAIGRAVIVFSACRCPIYNASPKINGAPLSQHRATEEIAATAFDLALVIPKPDLIRLAMAVGFTGIGVNYANFVHVDNRPYRVRF